MLIMVYFVVVGVFVGRSSMGYIK